MGLGQDFLSAIAEPREEAKATIENEIGEDFLSAIGESVSRPLPKKPFIAKAKDVAKAAESIASQLSFGAQETLLGLGKLVAPGQDFSTQLERIREDEPTTGIEKAARTVGEFIAPSPLGPAASAITKTGAGIGLAQKAAIGKAKTAEKFLELPGARKATEIIVEKATELKQTPKKVVKQLGRVIAGLEGGGFSEKVGPYIRKNPSILFEPVKPWQKIWNEAFDTIQKKKTEIGKRVGELKEKVFDIQIDKVIDPDAIVDGIKEIQSQLPIGSSEYNSLQKFKNLIKSGGDTLSKPKKKLIRESLGIDDLQKILEGTETTSTMKTIANKAAQTPGTVKYTPPEAKVLGAKRLLTDIMDNIVDDIDDEALKKGLISAKGEYARLIKQNQLIGSKLGIAKRQIPNKLRASLLTDGENDFDAFMELLGPEQYNEVIGKLLNQGARSVKQSLSGIVRPLSKLGVIFDKVFATGTKAGSVLAGEPAPYKVGRRAEFLLGSRDAIVDSSERAIKGAIGIGKQTSKVLGGTTMAILKSPGFQQRAIIEATGGLPEDPQQRRSAILR